MNFESLGLVFVEDFLTVEEETNILAWLGKSERKLNQDPNIRNTVRRFGPRTPYHNGNLSTEIPEPLEILAGKIIAAGHSAQPFKSVSINEYLVGQSIGAHIDSRQSGPSITIISLGSPATMRFSKQKESFDLIVTPRSLMQMNKEIRYKWKHEILPVTEDRFSIVFRCND